MNASNTEVIPFRLAFKLFVVYHVVVGWGKHRPVGDAEERTVESKEGAMGEIYPVQLKRCIGCRWFIRGYCVRGQVGVIVIVMAGRG